jgi:hypothetical protein
MAQRFTRSRRGITARFDDAEQEVLRDLFTDVAALLDDDAAAPVSSDPLEEMVGITEGATRPQDPALARLLPDASSDDDAVSAEFRRYTERGLRRRKHEALATAAATLERVGGRAGSKGVLVVDEEEAGAWLTALTDVRLVLAERMGVRTDADAERLAVLAELSPAQHPGAWMASVYDFLTWLQETLVVALSAPAKGA